MTSRQGDGIDIVTALADLLGGLGRMLPVSRLRPLVGM